MNFKTTYILFGTLVVLLVVLLVSQKGYKETSTTGYVLPSLHAAKIQAKDIDAVELERKGEKPDKLLVGTESAGRQQNALLFVNSSDLPKAVLAVPRSQLDYLYKSVNDFRAHDLLAEGALNFPDVVSYIKLQAEKPGPVILEKNDKN